jgi:hypothetical protein
VVLDVERVVVVELRQAALLARKTPVMRHVNRRVAQPRGLVVVVEAVVPGQFGKAFLELEGEAVEEVRPRAPEELDAQLPRRLGLRAEALRIAINDELGALALLQNGQAAPAKAILLTFEPDRLGTVERGVWFFARAQMLDLENDSAGVLAALNEVDVKTLFPKQLALVNELRLKAEAKLGLQPAPIAPEPAATGQ